MLIYVVGELADLASAFSVTCLINAQTGQVVCWGDSPNWLRSPRWPWVGSRGGCYRQPCIFRQFISPSFSCIHRIDRWNHAIWRSEIAFLVPKCRPLTKMAAGCPRMPAI